MKNQCKEEELNNSGPERFSGDFDRAFGGVCRFQQGVGGGGHSADFCGAFVTRSDRSQFSGQGGQSHFSFTIFSPSFPILSEFSFT